MPATGVALAQVGMSLASAPAAVATPLPTATTGPQPKREVSTHIVKAGDTLGAIAEQYGVSVETVVQANNLPSLDVLAEGQQLRIPPVSGVIHVVKNGDSLESIANQYGASIEDIVATNAIANADALRLDQELVVPGAQLSARGLLASRGGQRSAVLPKPSKYVVQPGDSVGGIADRFGISVETMLWANQIDDPNSIIPGSELVVLPVSGVMYTVKAGDTILSIAERFGADPNEVMMANGIDDPLALQVGDKVVMPGGKLQPTPRPQPTSTPTPVPAKPTATPKPAAVAVAPAQPATAPTQAP
ncbi:MAG: LysM peptidoglycan-binding domain-containing protein, partial [Chloroflexota bacterium]